MFGSGRRDNEVRFMAQALVYEERTRIIKTQSAKIRHTQTIRMYTQANAHMHALLWNVHSS